jgi:hypothetical protein
MEVSSKASMGRSSNTPEAPKRARVRLGLITALEFAEFHAHVAKSAPKKADERTARTTERALSERWKFRCVQSFCRAVIVGAEPERSGATGQVPVKPLLLFTEGAELRIRKEGRAWSSWWRCPSLLRVPSWATCPGRAGRTDHGSGGEARPVPCGGARPGRRMGLDHSRGGARPLARWGSTRLAR